MRAPTLRPLAPAALLAVLLLPGLAASGGGADATTEASEKGSQAEDEALADWEAALADELGTGTFDFASMRQAATADCVRTDAADWTVELALSGDLSTSTLTR